MTRGWPQNRPPPKEAFAVPRKNVVGAWWFNIFSALAIGLLRLLFRVRVHGIERLPREDGFVLVSNHVSLLDGLLLRAFIPRTLVFAVDSVFSEKWWARFPLRMAYFQPIELFRAIHLRKLVYILRGGGNLAIFPEGRVTVTGGLMKTYPGAAVIASKREGAPIVPVHLDGSERTLFSYQQRRFWFPRIRIVIGEPTRLAAPADMPMRAKSRWYSRELWRLLSETAFYADDCKRPLAVEWLNACQRHGWKTLILSDLARGLHYRRLMIGGLILGKHLQKGAQSGERENIGVMLPTSIGAAISFIAAQLAGRPAVMLNFSAGEQHLLSACRTASLKQVLCARRFVEAAKLEPIIAAIEAEGIEITYLDEWMAQLRLWTRLSALLRVRFAAERAVRKMPGAQRLPDDTAAILFTSGSEGDPKGVALSHRNLIANCRQVKVRLDVNSADKLLNKLPIFHSFGLIGTLFPLFEGVPVCLYPSPLDTRIIPEVVHLQNITVFFSTDSFLSRYGLAAHPGDFSRLRLVVAGAEKLSAATRNLWHEKFGIRILEGYGVTETAPVISFNTPLDNGTGTVGRPLSGIECRFEPVEGLERGGRLLVKGPNVMRGYLFADDPGQLQPPQDGWHDTGDIVELDGEGRLVIVGRARRFAKVGGEMVPLGKIEELMAECWPEHRHAVIFRTDQRRGETILALTEAEGAELKELRAFLADRGLPPLWQPRSLQRVQRLPLLATGKMDYRSITDQMLAVAEATEEGGERTAAKTAEEQPARKATKRAAKKAGQKGKRPA